MTTRPRGARWVIGGVVVVALGVGGLAITRMGRRADRLRTFPASPPGRMDAATVPLAADFVGADQCAECHAAQYTVWTRSTHGRAGAAPPGNAVIAPFTGRPMRFRDATVIPDRTADGGLTFTVTQPGRPVQRFTVAAVVGGGHMNGGGTQSFFSAFPDGTLRFLPFDFIRREGVWFCNTNGRSNRGWVPITPAVAIAECGDWPPHRVLGNHARRENCQQCHGSQIRLVYDRAERRYDTRFATLAIDCEACHGPGKRHVVLARSGQAGTEADIGVAALATLDKDASLQICFQCHALKDEVRPGDYSLGLSALTTRPHFPDGRIRFFAYQETHRFSACYFDGSMTCTSCHDPHSQGYRDVAERPLGDRFADGQCLGCHPSKAAAVERHTNHAAGSAGSRCVACHMPYVPQPNVGTALRYARSDHSIPIPRPAFDAQLGVSGACRQCHPDRPVTQLDADVRAWYGELKPHPEIVTALFAADRAANRLEEARRLLTNDARHAAAQLAALGHFALHRLRPDMADLEPEIVVRLTRLAEHPDVDVRALALASLHFAAGGRRVVWRFLARRLREERAAEPAVRARWVAALRFRGAALAAQGEAAAALATYRKVREVAPDDPQALADEAAASANAGDIRSAITLYRAALARDSGQALTLANLGIALEQVGDVGGALAAFERAVAIEPLEPSLYVSLGNLLQRRDRPTDAALAYERAVTLDPGHADQWFALAQAYGRLGDTGRTIAALQRGLELDPNHQQARAALNRLLTPSRR